LLALAFVLGLGCAGAGAGTGDPDAGDPDGGSPACNPPQITYANFGMAFLDTYCNRCHGFTQQSAQLSASALYGAAVSGGASSFMPPVDPKPSLADRMRLGEWLNCGAP
jgi:hypothetical protein